jgi:predicted nucleotidyltransferase
VVLFGSYANGSSTPDSDISDIDILVIEENINSKLVEINKRLSALKNIPFPKDIIVASQDEYDFYSKEAGSVFRTVAEKGVVIYG